MVLDQQRSKRKPSGGKLKVFSCKKKSALGRDPTLTKIGSTATKIIKVRGGNSKVRLLRTEEVNLYIPKDKEYAKATVEKVVQNQDG